MSLGDAGPRFGKLISAVLTVAGCETWLRAPGHCPPRVKGLHPDGGSVKACGARRRMGEE